LLPEFFEGQQTHGLLFDAWLWFAVVTARQTRNVSCQTESEQGEHKQHQVKGNEVIHVSNTWAICLGTSSRRRAWRTEYNLDVLW
jgi:hypothetical protein